MLKKSLPAFLLVALLALPSTVSAHAFGQQYNLPVPVWLYLYGGAAAVIISFIVVGMFLNQPRSAAKETKFKLGKFRLSPTVRSVIKYISLFLFFLTIATGLFGTRDSLSNFNMTFFWIIFLLGLTYFIGIFGGIWPLLNPWKTITEIAEKVLGKKATRTIPYNKRYSYLPAFVFYFLLIWTELISKVDPFSLSLRIIIYSVLSFILIFLYGKDIWLEYFDFFSLFFRLISKISPLEYKEGKFYLRAPFIGLINGRAQSLSQVLFIVFMLSSTAFDGFHSTTTWFRFEETYLAGVEQSLGQFGFPLVQTIALFTATMIFFFFYLLLVYLMKLLIRSNRSLKDLALDFGYSLIPIAFVYNIAHYYTLLLIQGQAMLALISDPFGLGWNLFNTANFTPNIALIGAKFVWNSQVAFIILGHIAGVYLAHLVALKVFPTYRKAVVSQFPMLFLMVCYTVAGLWILSQPFSGAG